MLILLTFLGNNGMRIEN